MEVTRQDYVANIDTGFEGRAGDGKWKLSKARNNRYTNHEISPKRRPKNEQHE
jgi:hypothetical protein